MEHVIRMPQKRHNSFRQLVTLVSLRVPSGLLLSIYLSNFPSPSPSLSLFLPGQGSSITGEEARKRGEREREKWFVCSELVLLSISSGKILTRFTSKWDIINKLSFYWLN